MSRFIIDNKVYDTSKMEWIAKVKKWYKTQNWFLSSVFGGNGIGLTYDCDLFRSIKGNWLIVHTEDYNKTIDEAISEEVAKKLLLKYDYDTYRILFEELEEA